MINSRNIHEGVHTKAFHIREEFREELKGKLLALKVDGATRHDRSVLGINVQFIANGRIHIRTIAMIELKESHTAQNLRDTILDILHSYGLTIYNVYSLTSDNARNMIAIAKLIGKVGCEVSVENLLALDSKENSLDENEQFESGELSEEQIERNNEHAKRLTQIMDDLIDELSSVAPQIEFNTRCESIRFVSQWTVRIWSAEFVLFQFFFLAPAQN